MMRSVDALPARTEANLESVNGRSAEFFKTSVLSARRKLIPRLSFQTSVIYRGTYGRKIPLSAMDDSCMILWWVKNKRPYQIFVASPREFMDEQITLQELYRLVPEEVLPPARLRHQFLLSSQLKLTTRICNLRINLNRVCGLH